MFVVKDSNVFVKKQNNNNNKKQSDKLILYNYWKAKYLCISLTHFMHCLTGQSLTLVLTYCHAFDHFACCMKQPSRELTRLIVRKTQVTAVLCFFSDICVELICVCCTCFLSSELWSLEQNFLNHCLFVVLKCCTKKNVLSVFLGFRRKK